MYIHYLYKASKWYSKPVYLISLVQYYCVVRTLYKRPHPCFQWSFNIESFHFVCSTIAPLLWKLPPLYYEMQCWCINDHYKTSCMYAAIWPRGREYRIWYWSYKWPVFINAKITSKKYSIDIPEANEYSFQFFLNKFCYIWYVCICLFHYSMRMTSTCRTWPKRWTARGRTSSYPAI